MKKIISAVVLCLLLVSCGPPQDGHGSYEYDTGIKYVGEYKDGKFHGQGTATHPEHGSKYVGEWKDGEMHGQGTYTWPDGAKYVGEWRNDKFHRTIPTYITDDGVAIYRRSPVGSRLNKKEK